MMDATEWFTLWTQTISGFMEEMAKFSFSPSESSSSSGEETEKATHTFKKSLESSAKIFSLFFTKLSEPENIDSWLKGMETVPEFMMEIGRQAFDTYVELQTGLMDQASRMGTYSEAYSFDDFVIRDIFKKVREIYEKEFRKYFHVPQLGLTRFHQERFNRFIDEANIYQNALNEFLYMFMIPMEKTSVVFQEKVGEMLEEGEILDNYKDYYNMWMKILEGHYMTLLKSPEYTQVLNNTIQSLAKYKKARNDFIVDIMGGLPIPSNQEMDELYKELYDLKKRVRELEKKAKK